MPALRKSIYQPGRHKEDKQYFHAESLSAKEKTIAHDHCHLDDEEGDYLMGYYWVAGFCATIERQLRRSVQGYVRY